jgi:hypothetical protein
MTTDNVKSLEITYTKAETQLIRYSYFDLKTLDDLIVFLKEELKEVRDDLRSKFVIRLIRRLYKSNIMLKKLEKNTQAYNNKLNQFIDYGLQYYVDIVAINEKRYPLYSHICSIFCLRTSRFEALNEITKNLVRPSISSLISPMEEASDSYSEEVQPLPPSPSLPDNCQIVDPNKVSIVFEKDATPEKL